MSLSTRSVARPVATAMVFTALTVMGAFSYQRLQTDLFPELDFPSISVVTTYSGVAPEEVETLLTRPIERSVARVEGIDRIESFSAEGRSRVALRFVWGMELDDAMQQVRDAVERARTQLPDDADSPVVYRFNLSNLPVMEIAVESDLDEGSLRRFSDDIVSPYLERLAGVASAEVRGARDREIIVELDVARLSALGLSADAVVQAIRDASVTVPAGRLEIGTDNLLVRAVGEFASVDEIAQARITERGGVVIRVADVSTIVDGFEDRTSAVRINGIPAVRASIQKSPDANTIEVCDRLMEAIDTFNVDYAGTASLRIISDNSVFIRRSVDGVRGAMVLGAGLALLVLLLFLRDLRSMLVIGISIPISVIGTFLLMYGLGLTLNLITFGGLALGVGMLVDNAIVILENIYRKSEEGLAPRDAAIKGSEEVAAAIIASTLTTVVVFVPVVFLGGFAAVFFRQMAMVVTSALVCSLIVSLTLVPVLASLLLKSGGMKKRIGDGAFEALDNAYAAAVRFCLRRGVVVLVVALSALGGAVYFSDRIGTELLPEADESEVRIVARYPAGTSLDTTREAVERIEALVAEHVPEATDVLATMGSPGFWATSGEEFSSLRVNLVPVEERERSSDEVAAALRPILNQNLPGMRVFARAGGGLWIFRFLRGGDDRIRVEVRGFDLETADSLAAQVEARLAELEGVTDARASRERGGGELRLAVDREAAADLGLSAAEVSRTVSTLVQGRDAALYREGGDEFRVRVRLSDEDRRSVARLLAVPVALSSGATVSLDALVEASDGTTPKAIDRFNQERIVTIGAGLVEGADLGAVTTQVRDALRDIPVPEGFSVIVAGESAEQNAAFTSLGLGITLALLLVFMVMAGQFESFVQPVIILSAVPFAAIGVVIILVLTETTLNINSFMGCVVLVGVAVNNAIVLVDYANLLRRRDGYELDAAIIETARRRLRPILMTTATTLLALAPVAIGGSTGAENQTPLARVVVGGIVASSLVTLFLVPILYRWVSQLGLWWATRRAK